MKKIKFTVSILIASILFVVITYNRNVQEVTESKNDGATDSFVLTLTTLEEKQLKSTRPSSPSCGKICSYDWDDRAKGKYYPLLHKTANCSVIFSRMAHSGYHVVLPPPRQPPAELLEDFTLHGQCPVSAFRYYDESSSKRKPAPTYFNAKMFRKLLILDNVTNVNHYKDKDVLKPALKKYIHLIEKKRVAVLGTLTPWAEAIIVNLGASSVTTIEYSKLVIEHSRVTTATPYRLAQQFMNAQIDLFDTVFSYSSLEHSGLGRYGDPITPFGDLEASAQVWCMVKPSGHFILAVPVSVDRVNCSVVWNAHRIYGAVRLQHLTANWCVLEKFEALDFHNHHIFFLEKCNLTPK